MCEKCDENIKGLEDKVKAAQEKLNGGLYDRIFCSNISKQPYALNDNAAELKERIRVLEIGIAKNSVILSNSHVPFKDSYKRFGYKLERKLVKLREELEGLLDGDRVDDVETHALNVCKHEFIDVFNYKEESIYGESITITKEYILSYCKVCGYTINDPNVCTECMG